MTYLFVNIGLIYVVRQYDVMQFEMCKLHGSRPNHVYTVACAMRGSLRNKASRMAATLSTCRGNLPVKKL